jgi:hypothetical protein
MFIQDLVLCLQLTADNLTSKKPSDCFVNPPCECPNPGKEPHCEDCEHLEACLSHFQPHSTLDKNNQ